MNNSPTWARLLVHRNIQVTTITIGYIELQQGFEGEEHVGEKLN